MKDIPRGAYLDCFARHSEGHREHEDVAFGQEQTSRPGSGMAATRLIADIRPGGDQLKTTADVVPHQFKLRCR
jgi:hypothetical protein